MKVKVFNDKRTAFRTIPDVVAVRTSMSGENCKVVVVAGKPDAYRTYVFDPRYNPVEWREEDGEDN